MAKSLTDKNVENVHASESRREVPDGGMPGLYLIVQPSGSKSWAVRYRIKGNSQPKKLTLGPALSAKEADRLIRDNLLTPDDLRSPSLNRPMLLSGARMLAKVALDQAKMGTDPSRVKRSAPSEGPLATDVLKQYLERYCYTNMRPSTHRETARILRFRPDPAAAGKFLSLDAGPLWDGRRIRNLEKADIVGLINSIDAPVMANRTFATLRAFFNWCIEEDLLTSSPCTGMRARRPERKRDRILTNAEISKLWRAASAEPYPFGPFLKLLILTGQRREEVAGMRWHEIDVERGIWTIPRERAKNDTAHEVPLSKQALQALSEIVRLTDSQLVFTVTRHTSISGFSRFKARLDRSFGDCSPWTIHDIRRTVASGLAGIGIALPVVEKLLNHVSGSFAGIVGVYQHYQYAPEKRQAMDAWGDFIEAHSSFKAERRDVRAAS